MARSLPTVRVQFTKTVPGGPKKGKVMTINEGAFDSKKHKRLDPVEPEAKVAEVDPGVRIKDPTDPTSFLTILSHQFDAERHELWAASGGKNSAKGRSQKPEGGAAK